MTFCSFVPPYLLARVAQFQEDAQVARCGRETLLADERLRARRLTPPPVVGAAAPSFVAAEAEAWTVFSADHGTELPGRPVRSAGEPEAGDLPVDEAAHGAESSLALFREAFGRDSYDNRGGPVTATVHYGQDYDNAFWDGRQLVFGDGDGRVFERFTKPVDVFGHEFGHAVVQYTAGLVYEDQPGALNESVSDVFAVCLKQWLLGQTADEADWLVGEGLFLPTVRARALRSMTEPGTAYDDPVLGRDPQVGHMDDFVRTEDDHGGVHLNSGIPNRAFALVATMLGGRSWERAGRLWYAALAQGGLGARTGFAGFAAATVAAAERAGDREARSVVADAWAEVGVPVSDPTGRLPAGAPSGTPEGAPGATDEDVVEVTRSGGFAGMTVRRVVPLTGEDPRAAEVRMLLEHIDFGAVSGSGAGAGGAAAGAADAGGPAQPDRFVYSFRYRDAWQAVVPEQALTPELSRLARLVLDQ